MKIITKSKQIPFFYHNLLPMLSNVDLSINFFYLNYQMNKDNINFILLNKHSANT